MTATKLFTEPPANLAFLENSDYEQEMDIEDIYFSDGFRGMFFSYHVEETLAYHINASQPKGCLPLYITLFFKRRKISLKMK